MPRPRQPFGKLGAPQQHQARYPRLQTVKPDTYAATCSSDPDGPSDSFSPLMVLRQLGGMLFSFNGRIGRSGYIAFSLLQIALIALVSVAYFKWIKELGQRHQHEIAGIFQQPTLYGYLLAYLLVGLMGWSVTVRRLHDRDLTGFWICAWFIPVVGSLFAMAQISKNLFSPGSPGTNRFGTE